MKNPMKILLAILTSLSLNPVAQAADLSGPRLGFTHIAKPSQRFLSDRGYGKIEFVSQFGWQVERTFFSIDNGPEGTAALVLLVGGAEQGFLLPSASWVVGMRSYSGYELVAGPNVSISGIGLAIAAGKTFRVGQINVPINLSLVTSRLGPRISLLFGFNSAQ